MGWTVGWLKHALVAVAYALAYMGLREVGFSHWVPLAGLRLSVLLLAPRRYWPSILIGEAVPNVYLTLPCIDAGGWLFFWSMSVPPIGFVMLVVSWCQSHLKGLAFPNYQLSSLLICILLSSIVLDADGLISASFAKELAGAGYPVLSKLAAEYFLGVYTGALSTVPLVLLIAVEGRRGRSAGRSTEILKRSRLVRCGIVAAVLVAVEVALFRGAHSAGVRFVGQALLFVPVCIFSVRWGWKGGAVMGAVASLGIVLLMPSLYDEVTMMTQTCMAMLITTFMVLGDQTSKLRLALRTKDSHLRWARLEQRLSESKYRQSAYELAYVNVELSRVHRQMLAELRNGMSREADTYRNVLATNTLRLNSLANGLAPHLGAGHPDSLSNGPILKLLDDLCIAFTAEIDSQWNCLSLEVQTLFYRLACESVGCLLASAPTDRLRLKTRVHRVGNGWKAALEVRSFGQPVEAPDQDAVMKRLGTGALDLSELRLRAQLYDGDVTLLDEKSIAITMREAVEAFT